MKDLLALALAISDETAGESFFYGSAYGDANNEDLDRLSNELRTPVEELIKELRTRIPNDVDFTLNFDEAGAWVALEYNDGNTTTSGDGLCFTESRALFASFEGLEWDEIRGQAISEGGIFEALIADAEDRPASIPSTEEAAKKYAEPLKQAVAQIHAMHPTPAFVAVLKQEELPIEIKAYETKEDMLHDFADALTCYYEVLAVFENGVETFYAQIESYKRQAIDFLAPGTISRAKAERRL
ncbi:conserved hypothetical protein [uncultured Defluviicoccus sp.]|uniref:Uncharacterized protein n=1 Tax=metagenome TaxID=256318 RepID=A0A380TGP9_9ZZZZ|nr:conserved hypothetical protein [uncultured Defluviicoccus sp.]